MARFEMRPPRSSGHDLRELPGATVHHGREAAAEHLRSVLRALPGYHLDTEELVDLGDTVVVCGRVSAHGRTSEVPVERPCVAVYTFDAGRVRRVRILGSRAEASKPPGCRRPATSASWAKHRSPARARSATPPTPPGR